MVSNRKNSNKCDFCGEEELLHFKCPFCSGNYCGSHRLPENHSCPNFSPQTPLGQWKSKAHKEEPRESHSMLNITKSTLHENCPKCGSERTMVTAIRKNCDVYLCMDCSNRWKNSGIEIKNMAPHGKPWKKIKSFKKPVLAFLLAVILLAILFTFLPNPSLLPDILTDSNEDQTETTTPETNPELYPEINLPIKEELETNPKNTSLKFVLRGNSYHFMYTVYDGVNEYLSELPRYITYFAGEPEPTARDFVMKFLNEDIQRDYLTELVQEIRVETGNKDDQARIAVSLVQQIPYDWQGLTADDIENRYPYEVIHDDTGVCGEKSRLLAFLLRELGFDVVLFNFESESHMAVGIKCPVQYSYRNTGYCFIETTAPTIITDTQGEYVGVGKLTSFPEIIQISDGFSFDGVSEEYNDAQDWIRLNYLANSSGGTLEQTDYNMWRSLVTKYGIDISN